MRCPYHRAPRPDVCMECKHSPVEAGRVLRIQEQDRGRLVRTLRLEGDRGNVSFRPIGGLINQEPRPKWASTWD